MTNKYTLPNEFLQRAPTVVLVGAGGTGSAMVSALADMCQALPQLGGQGLKVVVMDDDKVSRSNIGRQAFAPADIGRYKADVIVNRVNQTFGLDWEARIARLTNDPDSMIRTDGCILIGCVDTRTARAAIKMQYERKGQYGHAWWLDCGNEQRYGQVILGALCGGDIVLPCAADLFPEMVDVDLDAEDTAPSCSLPQALAKQDLFTNRLVANTAANLLWRLFRYGETNVHGAFVNLETMRTNPLQIDPEGWKRMGWEAPVDDDECIVKKDESSEIPLWEPETA